MSAAVDVAAVQAHCRSLRLPAVATHCERLAEEALRSQHSYLGRRQRACENLR